MYKYSYDFFPQTWLAGWLREFNAEKMLLSASGVAIILVIRIRRVALLLRVMLFLWVTVLHIPLVVARLYLDKGNEITSVFEALAFSGIALAIACMYDADDKKIKPVLH